MAAQSAAVKGLSQYLHVSFTLPGSLHNLFNSLQNILNRYLLSNYLIRVFILETANRNLGLLFLISESNSVKLNLFPELPLLLFLLCLQFPALSLTLCFFFTLDLTLFFLLQIKKKGGFTGKRLKRYKMMKKKLCKDNYKKY